MPLVRCATTGATRLILNFDQGGTFGCSETALLTMVVTSGTRPATADIMKLVEPWQWMTAWQVSRPVCSSTAWTSAGWSCTAAWSSVQSHGGRSMLARQLASQTSYPASRSASTSVVRTGARKMLPRTPAPCTSSTGPRVGAASRCTCTSESGRPSPAVTGTTVSKVAVAVTDPRLRPARAAGSAAATR